MASNKPMEKTRTSLRPNQHCPPEREINILLLGQTGVGKSTFINAFVNYLVNDTLEQAVNDKMHSVIPSSFSVTDSETFNERTIVIGEEDQYEQFKNVGQSGTQLCRSFVFPIGNRNLRFIDTPGVGDTKGLNQDEENFREILNYIAQYEHLNAVFIMFKPNEERLNILFRYSVYELLRHLNVEAKKNIIFIFTNARSTFFMPGSTKRLLQELLDNLRREHNVDVPLSKDNSFLFDNEAFRYLALRKYGVRVNNADTRGYTTSWDHSVNEYSRLMEHVNKCPLHAVGETLSLNEAEQLVRKLPRPIAETARLIEENIQLAKEHKKKVLEHPQLASQGIPQKDVVIETLTYPRTVCTGDRCCQVTGDGIDRKVEYLSICHERCYLIGVQQETLADLALRECEVIDPRKGICTICGCSWEQHKHITYECNTHLTHAGSKKTNDTTTNKELSLADIDKRIGDLRAEQKQIQDVYRKLARFLHAKSILPINDVYIDYLQYFIREEQMKRNTSDYNREAIASLEKMMAEYQSEMLPFKKVLQEQRDAGKETEILSSAEVFALAGTLYHLPINGKQIRAQVNGIKIGQRKCTSERENFVELPVKAEKSKVMLQLKNIVQ